MFQFTGKEFIDNNRVDEIKVNWGHCGSPLILNRCEWIVVNKAVLEMQQKLTDWILRCPARINKEAFFDA